MLNVFKRTALTAVAVVMSVSGADAAVIIDTPWFGVTEVARTHASSRPVGPHIVTIVFMFGEPASA